MPKVYTYNTVIDPISFRDRIEPLTLYKEEYDKQQEAYFKLLEESGDLAKLKDLAMDKDSYDIYEAYTNDINKVADEMGSKGISPETRNALLDLRRRKINEIDPLLKQQKIRADLVKRQDEYIKQHQGAFFDTDYSTTPLSKISDTSTFTPYDPNDILEKSYTTILNNMISNDGKLDVDYDSLKDMLGYNNLKDDASKKKFDNIMSLADDAAKSAYNKYVFNNYINELKATRPYRGGGSGRGSYAGKRWETLPTGQKIKVTRDKDGNVEVEGIDDAGKKIVRPVEMPDLDGMSEQEMSKAYSDALTRAYYGSDIDYSSKNKYPVFVDNDGSRYMLDINNNRVSVYDGITDQEQDEIYYGHNVDYLDKRSNGNVSQKYTDGKSENSKQHLATETHHSYKTIRSLKQLRDLYNGGLGVDDNGISYAKMLADLVAANKYGEPDKEHKAGARNAWVDLFNSGASIKLYPILSGEKPKQEEKINSGKVIGYRVEVVPNGGNSESYDDIL